MTVKFIKKSYSTTTSVDGKWQIELQAMKAGGPYDMEIKDSNKINIKNILIGDVWICSGQSNMTHYFGRHQERYAKEIAEANIPEIRQFYVPTKTVLTGPTSDFPKLKWVEATPESLLDFTVIGYFFAKKLYDKYDVPMGIINTSVGGTPIEAWTSEEGFAAFPGILKSVQQNKDTAFINRVNHEAHEDRMADGPKKETDKGLTEDVKWYDPAYQPLNWKRINIPGFWEDQGIRNLDGVVWYRREINVPESMTGIEAIVKLGRIVNADELYINGKKIGNTTYEYPQREYKILSGVLKPGKNIFVIRVINQSGKGGFVPDKPYFLLASDDTIDLKGDWYFKVGDVFRNDKIYKQPISAQNQPTSLYNGMIAPFTNFAVRGFLWYQGESNADNPEPYYRLLPNLISDWRNNWQAGDLPFLIAQLPNFMEVDYLPAESNWALIREAELQTALNTTNTGLGINIDLGEWNDIHPGNKKPVGERLALAAMRISYGAKEITTSGPIYKSYRVRGNKINISFDFVGIGLNYQSEGIRQAPEFEGTDRIRTAPQYDAFHTKFPDKVILSAETASAFSSRGVYLFPVSKEISAPTRDGRGGDSKIQQVSSYELHAVDFGSSADKVFGSLESHPFVAGEFVCTGWDYIGEPTPYYGARSSYTGIIDLAGFKKDRFYLYQSHWKPELP